MKCIQANAQCNLQMLQVDFPKKLQQGLISVPHEMIYFIRAAAWQPDVFPL